MPGYPECAGGSGQIVAGLGQGMTDCPGFEFIQFETRHTLWRRALWTGRKREIGCVHGILLLQRHCTLENKAKLANISGPGVLHQPPYRRLRHVDLAS